VNHHFETRSDTIVCRLSGSLSFDDHDRFREAIQEATALPGPHVELNLERLGMIDSAGVGLILLLNDQAKRAGKSLRLVGASGAVKRSLEILKIHTLVPTA
jgi:anti-anti-sigma factor